MPINNENYIERPDTTYVARPKIVERTRKIYQAPESAIERYTSPAASSFVEDIVRATYNRLFGSILPWKGRTVTEKKLPGYFMEELGDQVKWLSDKHFGSDLQRYMYFKEHPNDTVSMPFTGKAYSDMYGSKYADGNQSIKDKLSTKRGQVEHTLGAYNAYATKDGDFVKDTYDFNVGQGNYAGSTSQYSGIRRFGGKYGSKSTDPDDRKIKFNIKVKR